MASVGAVHEQTTRRLVHLDRLKIVLIAAVIVSHAAMSYGAVGIWIYVEDSLSSPTKTILSVLIGLGVVFVLGLFFLISGMLISGSLHRRGPRRFLLSRLGRLGIPVVAYALVVWPLLQWWIERVQGHAPTFWEFYRRAFSGGQWQSRGTGPMWFVEILLVVTIGWCLWRWRVPARPSPLRPTTGVLVAAGAVAGMAFLVRSCFAGFVSVQFLDLHVWLWPQSVTLFAFSCSVP